MRDNTAARAATVAWSGSDERRERPANVARLATFETHQGAGAWVSQHYRSMHGLPADARVDLTTAWATIHPDDRSRITAELARLAAAGGTFQHEYRVVHPDGTVRWIEARGEVAAGPNGVPSRTSSIHLDITERKEEAAALAESELSFRSSFDLAGVGFAHVGLDGRWIRVNRRICEMLGYSEDELLRGSFQDVTHPDDLEADLANVRALLAGEIETYSMEKRYIRKGGAAFWISLTVSLLRDNNGAPAHFVSVVEDISKRRAAEATLADNEARLADLVATLDLAAVLVRELDGRIKFWAAGCERVYGWSAADAVGCLAHDLLASEYPVPREEVTAALLRDGGWRGDVMQRRRDGSPIIAAVRKVLRRDAMGQPVTVMESMEDVTELRRAEDGLRHAAEALEVRVQDAVAAREAAQAQLNQAEKLTALGQLAGGIAHDFKNVLQAVRSGCGLLRRRANDPVAIMRYVGMIDDVTARGIAVTQRLLAFGRRSDLRAVAVDADAMIFGLSDLFSHTLGGEIVVYSDTEAGLPPLLADQAQLETVLMNLAANARDAMSDGGTLTLSAHAMIPDECGRPTDGSVLFTSALEATCYVRLSIADTGVGMTPDVLARVTEPFFTTKPAGKGTGLGLAMAKGFAEQSGGGLGIASAPGRGTRIDLWLPVAEPVEPVAPPLSETVRPAAVGGGKRILVVDDDESVRRFVADHLRDEGYDVVTAVDGPAALAVLDGGEAIDLVVCDLSMPRMNGVDVIAQMHLRNADLPAILLTGFATQAAQLAAKALTGAFVLLHKPVSEENLSAHVAMLLED